MANMDVIDAGKQPKQAAKRRFHIPSQVQPDTLFHFVSSPEYLFEILKMKAIAPRYCAEDVRYLRLNMKMLAYPMSCFCDISLQKLEQHMACYGFFGVAFPKAWCIEKGLQPVLYMNSNAMLMNDFRVAFRSAMRLVADGSPAERDVLADYLVHQLMYYKPYQGRTKFRVDGRNHNKCFADECEWRYIPDLSAIDMPMVVRDQWAIDNYKNIYNEVLKECDETHLKFDYDDLKYIMVKTPGDFSRLLKVVDGLKGVGVLGEQEANRLLSKVLVWTEIKGDL